MNKNIFKCNICRNDMIFTMDEVISCPVCGSKFPMSNGIYMFTSPQQQEDTIFSADVYAASLQMETKHFWYLYRLGIVKKVINRFIPDSSEKSFVEIGCGNGYMAIKLSTLFAITCGIDTNINGLKNAAARSRKVIWSCLDVGAKSDIEIKADVLGLFDVLEHIHDSVLFLKRIKDLIVEGGFVVITVPAFEWLWSEIDFVSDHKRRYSKKKLLQELELAGFSAVFISYFMFFTFPAYIFQRLKYKISKRRLRFKEIEGLSLISPVLNRCGQFLGKIETHLINNVRIPFGSSIVCVARVG